MVTGNRAGPVIQNQRRHADDVLVSWGTDRDVVALLRAAIQAADTALTDVLIGTPISEALAANSLIISNVTAAGDIALYVNRGGNSEQFLFMDASTNVLYLMANFGGIMLGLAADPPAPDRAGVHIWDRSAGAGALAVAAARLIIESSDVSDVALQFLTINSANATIYFGDPESASVGYITYGHTANNIEFQAGGAVRQRLGTENLILVGIGLTSDGAYTIATGAGDLTLNPTDNIIAGAGVFYRSAVTAGITASTTQTQGNGALVSEVNEVSVCANINDTVTLPSAIAGMRCVVINNGAQTLRIFPASGDNLGAGVDTATTLAAGSNVVYQAYDATNWESI